MCAKRLGEATISLDNAPGVLASASCAGKKEGEGPLKRSFDFISGDARFGERSWERSESALLKKCLALACGKAGLAPEALDLIISGDLLNQCAGSAYALSVNGELYGGLYGAWNAGVTNELVDWVRVATRVSRFYLDEFASPVWLDQQDMLHTPDAHVPAFLPEEWMSAPADISVARMTGPYEAVLLSTEEGELLAASYYGSGSLEPVGEGGDVAAMYTIGESRSYAVIEYKDGSAQVWDPAAGRLWELEDFLQDKEHIPY